MSYKRKAKEKEDLSKNPDKVDTSKGREFFIEWESKDFERMNVLSLFDGCSGGQQALERAGIKYNKYYASEIDKYAIQVTQHNYPGTIQLGKRPRC